MIEGIHWTSRAKEKVRTMGLFNNPNNDPNNRNIDPNAPNTRPGMPQLSQRNIIIIGLVVLAAIFLLPRLLNTGGSNDPNTDRGTNNDGQTTAADYNIGDVVVSPGITSAGCATESVTSFSPNERIYLVAENSDVPANTDIFGRLYYEGQEVEDSDVITSDRDYTDSCFNIWFESDSGFDSGDYTAQFFINGNAGPEINFEVQ
jgi:hypothetical protein